MSGITGSLSFLTNRPAVEDVGRCLGGLTVLHLQTTRLSSSSHMITTSCTRSLLESTEPVMFWRRHLIWTSTPGDHGWLRHSHLTIVVAECVLTVHQKRRRSRMRMRSKRMRRERSKKNKMNSRRRNRRRRKRRRKRKRRRRKRSKTKKRRRRRSMRRRKRRRRKRRRQRRRRRYM